MEKKKSNELALDDTEVLSAVIETSQSMHSHTEYVIKVQRGSTGDRSWQIVKRYSDFVALNATLQASGTELQLPPKRVFGNMEREFIAERQIGLQNYLNNVLTHPVLSASLCVKRFLDEANYSSNFQELSLQHVSMFFRSEPVWEVLEPLPEIGWRIRKQYFLVKNNNDLKQKYILYWCEFGTDKYMNEKDIQGVLKALPSIKHTYLFPTVLAACGDSGSLAIRPLNLPGTLRDYIYRTRINVPYLRKYAKPKEMPGLQLKEIRIYARQILEALKFLHEKGFPYGHLHTGNVVLEGGMCKITDLENQILGLPSFYRPFCVQLQKVQTLEAVDVYCFGHVLYEMMFAEVLITPTCDAYSSTCPPQIKSVLESVLTTEACKGGLPTVADLLSHTFFQEIILNLTERPVFKIPSSVREALKLTKEKSEARLREDQKLLRKVKRLSKAQEERRCVSEEEKKKRKQNFSKRKSQATLGREDSRPTSPNSNASTCSAPPTPPPGAKS